MLHNVSGRRCRNNELLFPSEPVQGGFSYMAPYLNVYCDTHIDVFNVHTAEWIQTINLKKVTSSLTNSLLTR